MALGVLNSNALILRLAWPDSISSSLCYTGMFVCDVVKQYSDYCCTGKEQERKGSA